MDVHENDMKVLINAIDLLEEQRPLHPAEAALRRRITQGLQDIHSEKLAFWQQRFHTRLALEWDEKSRFFHVAASGRRRRNAISSLDYNGVTTTVLMLPKAPFSTTSTWIFLDGHVKPVGISTWEISIRP